jgi:MFS family permease
LGPLALHLSLRPSRLRRNLLLDMTSWAGIGITTTLLGALLPASLRQAGMEPAGLAVLAALPFAAAALAVLAGRYGPRSPRALGASRFVGAAALGAALIPTGSPWLAILAAAVFWTTLMMGMPLQQRLWGTMYPEDRRGRLLGIVTSGRYSAAALALALGGLLALRLDGLTIIAIGGLVGAICALAGSRFSALDRRGTAAFSARVAIGTVVRHGFLRRITLAHSLWGGGLVASAPLVVLVQVDRLGLGVVEVGWIAMTGVLATLGSLFLWGMLADRRGGLTVMLLGSLLGVLAMLLYATAEGPLAVAAGTTLVGLAIAAAEVAVPLLIVSRASAEQQAPATAGMNALLGVRGMVVPLVAIAPVQAGLADVGGALLACGLLAGLGALVYLRLAAAEGRLRAPQRPVPAWLAGPAWRSRVGRVPTVAAGGAVIASIGARFASLR